MKFKKGDLCVVTSADTHTDPHQGDMVLITKERLAPNINSPRFVEGYNLSKTSRFHYNVEELKKTGEQNEQSN